METEKHLLLKNRAKQELLNQFNEDEIFFEYAINIDNKKYIVDVVGINEDSKIAVECGFLQGENRISVLSKYFDKVVHIPYVERKVNKINSRLKKKTYYIYGDINARLKKFLKTGYVVTESELVRRALNIGLDNIEKKVLDKGDVK